VSGYIVCGGAIHGFFCKISAGSGGCCIVLPLFRQSTKPNRPPLLTPVGTQRVLEGAKLEFGVQATDPDGAVPAAHSPNVP